MMHPLTVTVIETALEKGDWGLFGRASRFLLSEQAQGHHSS